MSLGGLFMEVARGVLPPATFDEIYGRAVAKERERIEKQSAAPAKPVAGAVALANVASYLSDEPTAVPKPHAMERIRERVDAEIGHGDMVDLLRFIQAGGPNVQVTGQKMDLTQDLLVNWRGKHFVVVWSKSRGKIITVFAKRRKQKGKVWAGRPRDKRQPDYAELD